MLPRALGDMPAIDQAEGALSYTRCDCDPTARRQRVAEGSCMNTRRTRGVVVAALGAGFVIAVSAISVLVL